FQAEDGIRGLIVTAVQTCALPICLGAETGGKAYPQVSDHERASVPSTLVSPAGPFLMQIKARSRQQNPDSAPCVRPRRADPGYRSEERRVGKECGLWVWASQLR